MKELAQGHSVFRVALWKMDVTCTGEVQHWKSSAHSLPSRSSVTPQNVCVHLVKVAVLPASVLANPEAQLG